MLIIVSLHDNYTPDTEDVVASQAHGTPSEAHADWAEVVGDLRNEGDELIGDFFADRAGNVVGEGGRRYRQQKLLGDTKGGSFVEF